MILVGFFSDHNEVAQRTDMQMSANVELAATRTQDDGRTSKDFDFCGMTLSLRFGIPFDVKAT